MCQIIFIFTTLGRQSTQNKKWVIIMYQSNSTNKIQFLKITEEIETKFSVAIMEIK
jgi:hypothetical protein